MADPVLNIQSEKGMYSMNRIIISFFIKGDALKVHCDDFVFSTIESCIIMKIVMIIVFIFGIEIWKGNVELNCVYAEERALLAC